MTRTGAKLFAAGTVFAMASGAQAGAVGFAAYSNNSGTSGSIVTSAVLSADATSFTIELNNGSSQGAITDFYLETGAALSSLNSPVITNGSGVSFSPGAAPPSPNNVHNAGGGAWGGNFFSMDSDSPVSTNGVHNGEWVKVTFSHDGSFSLSALEGAISSNDIRLVIHFQSWQGGASEWLSSSTAVVPLPTGAWAASGILASLLGVRLARRAPRRA
tara:strand:+ start:2932 stop:3579 length:648 start_codon:yes stop_codon:yes gene_type:complete